MAAEGQRDVASRADAAGRRLLVGLVLLLGSIVAWFIGAAIIPRWWAHWVGDRTNGSLTTGTILGIVIGSAFAALPILVLWLGIRFRQGWRRFVGFAIVAVILASPNLFTLGIVLGNGSAAHAGERTLDVEGPGFRGGSLVGAIGGVLAMAFVGYLVLSRRRSRKKVTRFKDQLKQRDRRDEEAAQTQTQD